jgi:hypothetical protein
VTVHPFSRSSALVSSTDETFSALTAARCARIASGAPRGIILIWMRRRLRAIPNAISRRDPTDFSLILSTNSVSVPQGSTSSPVNISVTGQNSFTGSVQISLSGLPAGCGHIPPALFRLPQVLPFPWSLA